MAGVAGAFGDIVGGGLADEASISRNLVEVAPIILLMNEANPYAPPQTDLPRAKRGARAAFAGTPRPWKTGEVLELAWQRVRTQKAVLMGASFCGLGLPQLVTFLPRAFFEVDARNVVHGNLLAYQATVLAAQLASFFLSSYFLAGSAKIWIDVARGKEARFGDLFGGFARTPSMLGMILLMTMTMAISVGFVCLIVPGIILTAGFSVAQYFVVDAEMGPMRALSASWEVTKGHRLALFGFGLAATLVMTIGAFACGFGMLLTYPIVYVALAIVYLRISGHRPKTKKAQAVVEDAGHAGEAIEAEAV